LNKTRIDWCDYSLNPIVGCKNNCSYCYARAITKRFPEKFPNGFEPTFYPERLEQPLKRKKPSRIFVCSMGELVAPWVPEEWVKQVIDVMKRASHHTFLVLTKAPEGYKKYKFPLNVWLGGTATNQKMADRACDVLKDIENTTFLSCEPLLGSVVPSGLVEWVIIGACSHPKPGQPEWVWVEKLVNWSDEKEIPVFYKNNLNLPQGVKKRTEFPERMLLQ
jgi:protein gp37